MNFKDLYILIEESFDNPYYWKGNIKTEQIEKEDYETGETYYEEKMSPVQFFRFETDEGIKYVLYFRQSRYDESAWEVAFGVVKNEKKVDDEIVGYDLDITLNNKNRPFRIFSTVLEIINHIIDEDGRYGNYDIGRLIINSNGEKRSKIYEKYIIPKIEDFELDDKNISGQETTFILQRYR